MNGQGMSVRTNVIILRSSPDFKAALAAAACARGVSMSELIRRELRPVVEKVVRIPARETRAPA